MDTAIRLQLVAPPAPRQSAPEPAKDDGKLAPAPGRELPPAPEPPEIEAVERAVKQINAYLTDSQRQLNFQIHEASGRTILRVINPATDEVIRQIPSEEALELAAALHAEGLQLINELA